MTTESAPTEQQSPITFTDAAKERIAAFLANSDTPKAALRLAIAGRASSGFRYALNIAGMDDRPDDDIEVQGAGFPVLIAADSIDDFRGATVDFVETAGGGGIQIDNPNPIWRDPLALQVQEVLDSAVNPGVASHGGWVDLLGVRGDKAYVRLGGGCQGCGMADVTLKQGIETIILERVPQITAVVDDTDHASGENPYYRPAKGAA